MKEINLREYKECGPFLLSVAQRDAIAEAVPSISIRAVKGAEDQYTLTPGSIVGALEVEGLSIHIKPKVCIRRLLYMALYAAGEVKPQEDSFPFAQADPTLADLVALHLGRAAADAFARGLLHGYRVEEEALHTVRGRIMVAEQIRRRFDMPLPVEVRYDEYTEDILANRLIKAAARLLRGMRLSDSQAREGLRHIDATLENVTPVRYPPHDVPKVEFTRLNDHYKEAVAIARLVLQHWFHEAQRAGDDAKMVRAPGFLMDMNEVFQQFVTRKLREELKVSERTLCAEPSVVFAVDKVREGADTARMIYPDLSLWENGKCTFVGDVKYKDIEPSDKKRLWDIPSADLYQALAYATALGLPGALLVYAKGRRDREPPPLYRVKCAGKQLEVVTVDLDGDIDAIDQSIAELAERVCCLRAEGRKLRDAQRRKLREAQPQSR